MQRGRRPIAPTSSGDLEAAPGVPGEILVVRPGALGDAVLTLPALGALLDAGARRVTVLGNPASWAFLRPDLTAVRVCDIDSAAWLGLFTARAVFPPPVARLLDGVDAAVVYLGAMRERVTANLRAAGIAVVRGAEPPRGGAGPGGAESGGPAVAGGTPDESGSGGPAGADGWRRGEAGPAHAARRLLAALAGWPGPAGGDPAGRLAPPPLARDPLLAPTAGELAAARRLLGGDAAAAARPLVLHPGSGGAAKRWPAERFAAVAVHAARRRGLVPVALFGPADEAARRAFTAAMPEGAPWLPVANRPPREVLALLSLARAHVGNDSGVTHLAARACPTLALFGPTDPAEWRPLGRDVAVLRARERRMDALATPTVVAALDRLLGCPPGRAGP